MKEVRIESNKRNQDPFRANLIVIESDWDFVPGILSWFVLTRNPNSTIKIGIHLSPS